jgi:hypothetical protein
METIYDDTPVDLRQFDESYRRAGAVQEGTPAPVPDGQYFVRVEQVELTTARTSGNPLLKWKLRIEGPDQVNRVLWKNRAITHGTMDFVKAEMKLCGLELEPFSQLPARLGSLTQLRLEVVKVTKGDSANVYFRRRMQTFGAGPADVSGAASVDDDLPF